MAYGMSMSQTKGYDKRNPIPKMDKGQKVARIKALEMKIGPSKSPNMEVR